MRQTPETCVHEIRKRFQSFYAADAWNKLSQSRRLNVAAMLRRSARGIGALCWCRPGGSVQRNKRRVAR
eukprot:8505685-Alexandrium_andersonii.AAC.1